MNVNDFHTFLDTNHEVRSPENNHSVYIVNQYTESIRSKIIMFEVPTVEKLGMWHVWRSNLLKITTHGSKLWTIRPSLPKLWSLWVILPRNQELVDSQKIVRTVLGFTEDPNRPKDYLTQWGFSSVPCAKSVPWPLVNSKVYLRHISLVVNPYLNKTLSIPVNTS